VFVTLALLLWRSHAGEGVPGADGAARRMFGFSIFYLFSLFAALLIESLAR